MSRDNWIKHNPKIANQLFSIDSNQLTIIADGTYSYCQKSSNNYIQRKTFSVQKHRHLVKPFVVTSADGLILDVYGPFPATKNDAEIMEDVLANDNNLRNLLKSSDHFLIGRGFQNCIKTLQTKYKLNTHMPSCVPPKQKQLTTQQANESRFVTKCRWPVEVANSLLKTLFRANDSDKKYITSACPR